MTDFHARISAADGVDHADKTRRVDQVSDNTEMPEPYLPCFARSLRN